MENQDDYSRPPTPANIPSVAAAAVIEYMWVLFTTLYGKNGMPDRHPFRSLSIKVWVPHHPHIQ